MTKAKGMRNISTMARVRVYKASASGASVKVGRYGEKRRSERGELARTTRARGNDKH